MKRWYRNRKTPLVLLCLLMAFALVLAGLSKDADDQASALPTLTVLPTMTILPIGLRASGWSPADGQTGVALNANVSVKFNMDLKESSIENGSNFYMRRLLMLGTIPASLSYSALLDTATLNPTSNLLPGTTYYVTLTDDVVSSNGFFHLLNAGTWSFTTDTAPQIVSRTPEPGATGVPVDSEVRITFNKKMLSAGGLP